MSLQIVSVKLVIEVMRLGNDLLAKDDLEEVRHFHFQSKRAGR